LKADLDWTSKCALDDSNCNWRPRFFTVNTRNETHTSRNRTNQFIVQNNGPSGGGRLDTIALFTNVPSNVSNCTVAFYKPSMGIFYGTYSDGAMNISTLDMRGAPFAEAVGSNEINYKITKAFIDKETVQGTLDLGNWGHTVSSAFLTGPKFACKGEVAVHFALNAAHSEGSVTFDQASEVQPVFNSYVQRAGWVLVYE